ncbi:zinc finger protein 709-like isoform X2 [Thrips palmi]|uniref:Zinc finger protein 709-like isoform X2 n=1 Tax=Thrips palmi TaxID=161013 RepID=A0A6P8ZI27_THRPL|nr:zinc finger protein 709-like isoform X2 [Thrips palmi]
MDHNTTYACVEYDLGEEQRLEGMCRVCASSSCELTPVFDSSGQSEGIVDLINNHLPILVTPTDLLPITICAACIETLSSIHNLVEVCVKANEKMQQMLQDVEVDFTELESYGVPNEEVCESSFKLVPSVERDEEKELEVNTLIEDQLVNVETSEASQDPPNESLNREKKLYRCLHCDMTDSNAYLLLLHQIKSHPGKLLKCSDCDFVYSADQRNKYNEHLKQHVKDHSTSVRQHVSDSSVPMQNLDLEDVSCGLNVDVQNSSKPKGSTKVVSKSYGRKKNSNDKLTSPNGVVRNTVNAEVHWRCGFCGMKAKSKMGLNNHCKQRHKERVGMAFSSSDTLECSRCKLTFGSEVWLKDHLCHSVFLPKTVPSPKQLTCLTCPEVFTDVKDFREHLLSHTNSVKCHICGAHFRSQVHLQPHLLKHERKKYLQCPYCPRSFKLRSRMKIHLRTHTGERPFMCVKCGKQFSTDSGFRLHMAAHEGKKRYVCSLCGQTFNRPSNLRRHETSCGGTKLQCSICKEKFSSREEMHCHRAMHSKEEKDAEQTQLIADGTSKQFSCKVCGMKFDRVVELSQHRKESHTAVEVEEAKKAGHVDGGAYVCPNCGKEVYNKKNYDRHMLLHTGNTQYQCQECSNIYSTKFALEYHMYTHTGERPFKCDLCPEGFKTRISQKIHRMKHTGEKPYKCRICSMGFITAASLRLHLVTHSDSRMFSCSYCPATFKRKKTLVTHIRIHTGEKPYTCKFCNKRFTQKGSCSQHEKTHTDMKNSRAVDSDMHVTVIKNWRSDDVESFAQDESNRIDILVAQDGGNAANSAQCEEVQHMVLIQQDVDCVIGEPDLMEISEDMVLVGKKHAIIIEQDGILAETPVTGLKDANSDPQMPVPDE